MTVSIEEIKEKITPILKEAGVVRSAVFGSAARGDTTKESDIDILVDIDDKKKMSLFDFVELKLKLEKKLGRKVDLVEYQTIKQILRDAILAQEIRIL